MTSFNHYFDKNNQSLHLLYLKEEPKKLSTVVNKIKKQLGFSPSTLSYFYGSGRAYLVAQDFHTVCKKDDENLYPPYKNQMYIAPSYRL
ncbi:hypothetical protein [Pueribacillus sp. YX66]|uniref:hypothetical protein n=1 Tax=Pueribacillus sp. YX66 TaxID=3229242 RepID=UPI00358D15A1